MRRERLFPLTNPSEAIDFYFGITGHKNVAIAPDYARNLIVVYWEEEELIEANE